MDKQPQITTNDLMFKLKNEKDSAVKFVERKYLDWTENYELYRNKVKTNRLTQRQAVNIPLMKETIKTILAKVDDITIVDWRELSGDQEKELIFQEIWNRDMDRINIHEIDIQDTKTVLMYGRAFQKLNFDDDGFCVKALDIYDVIIDPMVDPVDIETARFVIHRNIFRSLREILASDRYTEVGKKALRMYLTSPDGIILSSENEEEWKKKQDRLKSMGVNEADFPTFAGGDTVINLTEHYTEVWNTKTKEFERRVVCYANDTIELSNHTLEELLGVTFWPFVTWAEDIETQDFWSDSVADLIRTPNKVLNIWFSQMVENRTLRNFQMHWYDATVEGYQPQTYEPGPGRMLPAPGDPNKTIMPVAVDGLDETMNAINFLTSIAERASGATAIEKGQAEQGVQTLGEVQILVGKANERSATLMKLRRRAKEEFAMKYYQIVAANYSSKMTLYKRGRDEKMWPKAVYKSDWQSKQGYEATVLSSSEQEQESTKEIQKFQFVIQQSPNNIPLRKIALARELNILKLSPEEIKSIQNFEEQAMQQPQLGQPMPGQPQGQPSPLQTSPVGVT